MWVLELIDIEAVSSLAHRAGAKVIVDNVFATPILQKPIKFGADIVVYSATKHIDGQGRTLGGAILTNDIEFADGDLMQFLRHTGPSLSPFNAWVLLKGIETLEIRMAQHCANAKSIAEFLVKQKGLSKVIFQKSFPCFFYLAFNFFPLTINHKDLKNIFYHLLGALEYLLFFLFYL